MRSNPGQYYLDIEEYSSGVGWLCSTRYRGVRDDAVSPAGPSLFEVGMDLLDTTLGSGGGDQVRVRGRGSSGVTRGRQSGETRCAPGVGTAFRIGDVPSSKMTALWHQSSATERCSHAESTSPTGTGAAWCRPSLPVRALSQRCPSHWSWVRSARRCPNLQQRPRPGSSRWGRTA